MKNKLLVTFPVDLGNRTIESNLHSIFEDDMDYFRFAAQGANLLDQGINYWRSVYYRITSIRSLRKIVKLYSSNDSQILFNGLSPAFWAYGAYKSSNSAIVFDWTRLLYPSVLGRKIDKNLVYYLHKHVLKNCPKILCWTDAVIENLQQYYDIKPNQIYKVPAPFLVDKLDIPPRKSSDKPKVLFVGGDLHRKGGDVILNNIQLLINSGFTVSMLTNDKRANIDGVNFLPGIKYGTPEHTNVYKQHDILILPTRIDAYPQVIGEAAAAGLAVITTRFALGAYEVILPGRSGFIAETPEECITLLLDLKDNAPKLDEFKVCGYQHMHAKFSRSEIRSTYIKILDKRSK